VLALLSPKESKRKIIHFRPKARARGARAATHTAHPGHRSHTQSLHPSPHTPGPRPALGAQGAHPATAARGRGARPGAIYREFCHPLLARLSRAPPLALGDAALWRVLILALFYTVSRMCETDSEKLSFAARL
jgi:hypothetical protein